jgi:NADPH2:quinone reductase
MRAVIYEQTGPARDVLRIVEVPTPEPGAGEVRVKLATSGVNPSDVKSRAGLRTKTLAFPRITPHSDGAGVIDKVGAGVPDARVGERVWVWNAAWQRPNGTAAEHVVLPSPQAVRLPAAIDFAAGACLGIPALTAYQAIAVDGGVDGRTVLVAGGAGAVGHYAIQFAKLLGAKQVVTTVSSEEKAARARAAGAAVAVNYRSENVVERIGQVTGGRGVDRIVEVDIAGNIGTNVQAVAANGDIVVYGSNAAEVAVPFFPMIVKNVRLRFFIVYNLTPEDRKRAIEQVSGFLEGGKLSHNVAARLPLARIAEAHELVESGKVAGNVVVEIPGTA